MQPNIRHQSQPLLLIICIGCIAVCSATVPAQPEQGLMEALGLLSDYRASVRPPADNGTANTVHVFFNLNNLVKVNSAAQEITIQMWHYQYWTDSRLAWRGRFGSVYDNLTVLFVPAKLIWRPDVAFYELLSFQQTPSDATVVKVFQNGGVSYATETVATSKCPMQMAMFPYDTQTCKQFVSSTMHETDTMTLRVGSIREDNSMVLFLHPNNEFCIENVTAWRDLDVYYDLVTLQIVIRRRTTIYLVNLILPSLLLLAISALTFRLPPECGERVSFSVTIVLSMCVFLQLTGNYIPAQSDSVPLITYYYSLAVVMTMSNVLANVFVLNWHFRRQSGDIRVDSRIIRLLFLNRFVARTRLATDSLSPLAPDNTITERSQNEELKSTGAAGVEISRHSCHDNNEWEICVASADRCFFFVFVCVSLAILVAVFVLEVANNRSKCAVGRNKARTI